MNKEKRRKIQKRYQIMRYVAIADILILLGVASANAQESIKEYPKGKPIVTIFGDFTGEFQECSKPKLGFNLDRAYLGYQYEFNKNWKGKVVFDMGKGDDKTLQRIAYLKNAEADYRNGKFALNLGVTSTALFNSQEKFWGLRYVYKSYMDQRKWGSPADLGLLASYQFTDKISADVSVFNGEGYKKIQNDNHFQYGLGLTLKPTEGLALRAYGDIKTAADTTSQKIIAIFAGYQCKAFRIGAEYNMEFNHANANGHNLYGVSAYGAARLSDKAELYARYDYGKSSSDWEYSENGQVCLLGLNYSINRIFAISPNVRLKNVEGENAIFYACVSGKVNF